METVSSLQSAPLKGPSPESKMHKAAEAFVGTFFAQMIEEMFNEVAESSEESSFETEMYSSWLAEGMGKKTAQSASSRPMVRQIENMMRRQEGLDDLKSTSNSITANGVYKKMDTALKRESNNVCATAA